jgi:serine protease AprX
VIEVHSASHDLVSGANVAGSWSGGYTGTGTCTADGTGRCQIATGSISKKVASVMFTVSAASKSGYVYQSASNHDPDGDSNGTAIMINKP